MIPEPGHAVSVRGRPATVVEVRRHEDRDGSCHLVEVEYLDTWDLPAQDTLIWERELDGRVMAGAGWPRLDDGATALHPDRPELLPSAGATGSPPTTSSPAARPKGREVGREAFVRRRARRCARRPAAP